MMAQVEDEEEVEPAVFKPKPAGRSFRKRRAQEEAEPDTAPTPEAAASLHAMRTLQRQRARARGVALEAKGELDLEDQLGGAGEGEETGDVAAVLDATFTQQTEGGDVDPNMLRYIEEAMGKDPNAERAGGNGGQADAFDDESDLYKTPEFLLARRPAPTAQAADHEDAQRWLAGIEEVQLATEEKLLNIEQTEKAKAQMLDKLESRMRRAAHGGGGGGRGGGGGGRGGESALPGNFTSNFHHHRKSFAQAQRPNGFKPMFGQPGSGGGGGGGRGGGQH